MATWEDSLKLKKDLGIKLWGGYDVRHLIFKHPNRTSLYAKSGLSGKIIAMNSLCLFL